MSRILFVVTHPMTARILLRGQLGHLREAGFEVRVACGPGPGIDEVAEREGVGMEVVQLAREIRPWRDTRALVQLVRACRAFRPHVVNAGTPKAGLLGMLAARVARVPCRVYTLRGLRLETKDGLERRLLLAAERVTTACAHHVVCVSPSLLRRARELGLVGDEAADEKARGKGVPEGKAVSEGKGGPGKKGNARATVLGPGSSNGVDVERFRPPSAPADRKAAAELRRRLGIPQGAGVVGFVGRFTRDKGIADLERAFREVVASRFPDARLLLLGDHEEGDPVPADVRARIEGSAAVVSPGFVEDLAPWYRVMDVLALPSYREGFPNAPLEAAASGVPVVGYRVTGTVDAVADGRTGTLVPPGDTADLGQALCDYLGDPDLRSRHGAAGRKRAVRLFRSALVWERWERAYRSWLRQAGVAVSRGPERDINCQRTRRGCRESPRADPPRR